MPRPLVILACLAALGFPADLSAETYFVSPNTTNSEAELRHAIVTANTNVGADTIQLAAGTYQIQKAGRGENGAATGDLDILDNLNIVGAGADTTIIDGAGLDRIFHIIAATGAHAVAIADVCIRNGSPGTAADQVGGCLRNDGAAVTLTRALVLDGLAQQGGGIYSLDGTLVLQDSVVASNQAIAGVSGQGGGIYFRETTTNMLRLVNSIVTGNRASDDGGGIENYEGTVEILGSTLSANWSGDDGGGIENDTHGTGGFLYVERSAMLSNIALNGGAIDNDGFLRMVNTTIADNQATNKVQEGWGSGGIRHSEDTPAGIQTAFTNCTIYGNRAVIDDSLALKSGDISNISLVASEVRMQNTILGTCLSHVATNQNGTFVSLGNNVIQDSSGCQLSLAPGASPDIAGDPKLGLLTTDGTPGNAHRPLLYDSPAIDAADADVAPATDQLGQGRVDGDLDLIVAPDIGAFELQSGQDPAPAAPRRLLLSPQPAE